MKLFEERTIKFLETIKIKNKDYNTSSSWLKEVLKFFLPANTGKVVKEPPPKL